MAVLNERAVLNEARAELSQSSGKYQDHPGLWSALDADIRPSSRRIQSLRMTQQGREAWFALRVKPRHEKNVSLALKMKGYEEFLPLYTEKHRWSDRYKEVKQPLFVGYTFCYFDPERRLPILRTAGVSSIVGFGDGPAAIDAQEIEGVQAIIRSGLSAVPYPDIEVGDTVRLKDGPLCGLEGVLKQFRDSDRLVVAVSLLKRSVAVEIDRAWVDHVPERVHARRVGRD